ncbi:MAG: BON domain-containing protein [Acidobacteriaceae bacterium]|nr:BON domain-containing protein [Acidobacteriaceae bacterium]
MNRSFKSMLYGLVLSGALLAPSATYGAQNRAPDNTAVNKQDRDTQQPTADQAKNNRSDRDLEKHIRRDVIHDKSLSSYGHNAKIIADRGKVTLRGAVHSEDEKRVIEEHARKYAGDGHVANELTVKEDHDAKK